MNTNALKNPCLTFVIIVSGSTCVANNNLFLPGDAFFPTVLTKADVQALQSGKTGERSFAYSAFGGYEMAFCGYAGYLNATIPAVDDAFARNLAKVYSRLHKSDGRQLPEKTRDARSEPDETEAIRVLFYPREFDFPRRHLGLRYNEDWVSEAVKFGHKKGHLRLCCLIDDSAAAERSLKDADLVSRLQVKLPAVPLKTAPATESPVVVQGAVKAFVIGSHSLKELFRSDGTDQNMTIYVITADGITELLHKNGKWRTADFK